MVMMAYRYSNDRNNKSCEIVNLVHVNWNHLQGINWDESQTEQRHIVD